MLLNVTRLMRRSRVNGPGWRAAVWVQGCTLRCAGCFNPDTHAHERRHLVEPLALADSLDVEAVEGLSILGGEPFEQAEACSRLAGRARERGLSVVTYSGYTWAFLRRSSLPAVQALLASTDLLIAGPFVQRLANDGRGWHGSTNQEFVFLTDRYGQDIFQQAQEVPVVEASLDGGVLRWTGIPDPGDRAWLEQGGFDPHLGPEAGRSEDSDLGR
ncbi:radical SAM protein [Corallococcus sp. CA053C]|uniref:4Fe-4S single cluster domain-containing protein n=1 Tax=Corallococcus sp. CA053C TaxID=2316732 RepID=UPI000EA30FC3|nr:4Fe-4S single cluster domain-containing protein [Corallococcus sp. CA053C]RKH14118.1 radical SAM protein [Corallococcus sp. CA053C]